MNPSWLLANSVIEIYRHDNPTLAAMFFAMVVALPFIYLLATLLMVLPLKLGRHTHSFPHLARWVFGIEAMADVFPFAALVSLTKIAALATVELGISFEAFVLFVLAFARLVSNMNREWLWKEWETLGRR